jgi:hypothetical protein
MVYYGDDGPTRAEPMTMASEPSLMGERLRPLKRLAMNSRFTKRMVLVKEKPMHDKRPPPAAPVSANDGTI